jgi:tetratricopeptide (TPR) repeat protein
MREMPAVALMSFLALAGLGRYTASSAAKAPSAVQDSSPAQARTSSQPATDTSSASTTVRDSAISYRKAGDAYAKKGQTDKAMAAYRHYVDSSGPSPAVYKTARLLGEYYYGRKQYNESAQYLSMVKGKAREDVTVRVKLGLSLFRTGRYKDAIEMLAPLAATTTLKAETKRDVLNAIAESYFRTDRIDKASSWYEKYLQAGGKKVADLAYASALRIESDNPAKAKQRYTANMRNFPGDYRNYLRMGLLTASSSATAAKSASLITKAVTLAQKSPGAWLYIARVYGQLGKADAELSAYTKYLRIDPTNLEAQIRKGAILLAKGKMTEALKVLEAAHVQAPDSLGPTKALATVYLKAGRPSEAVELLVVAKASAPKDPEVRRSLFEAYSALGQDQQALDEVTALLSLKRDNATLLQCAKLLLKMGRFSDASAKLEDIRATDPENMDAVMTLALVLRGQQKFDSAIELYKEASTLDNKYAPVPYERAETHLLQGKPNWAEEFYGRALELDPKMAVAELGLAKVALTHQKRADYLRHLARASAMDPRNPLIAQEVQNSKAAPAGDTAAGETTGAARDSGSR